VNRSRTSSPPSISPALPVAIPFVLAPRILAGGRFASLTGQRPPAGHWRCCAMYFCPCTGAGPRPPGLGPARATASECDDYRALDRALDLVQVFFQILFRPVPVPTERTSTRTVPATWVIASPVKTLITLKPPPRGTNRQC
jgi:hypothetical protein